jgi:hypothetical protein
LKVRLIVLVIVSFVRISLKIFFCARDFFSHSLFSAFVFSFCLWTYDSFSVSHFQAKKSFSWSNPLRGTSVCTWIGARVAIRNASSFPTCVIRQRSALWWKKEIWFCCRRGGFTL